MKKKKSPWVTKLSPRRIQWVNSHVPKSRCRECNSRLTMATGQGIVPRPGDPTICIKCGTISVFDHALRLRPPTEDELVDFILDPYIRKMQTTIFGFVRKYGK